MPELPDLEYIRTRLDEWLPGRRIESAEVRQPLVLRMVEGGDLPSQLVGQRIERVVRHGPFLVVRMDGKVLVMHMMLAGRLQYAAAGAKTVGHLCFTLGLDNGQEMRYGDAKKMGRIYVDSRDAEGHPLHPTKIALYKEQGVDIMATEFTLERFRGLIRSRRQQVRVFIMDQKNLSAVGNAYADEILFDAGLHPKTICSQLTDAQTESLWKSVLKVMRWGIDEVTGAAQPIEKKVRDHMKVRNRKGEPCPACGTVIRRASVLGYDAFFCPRCQQPAKPQFLSWSAL